MRKRTLRPQMETLESMTLLSGAAGAAQPDLSALKAKPLPVIPHPLHLSGSIHGTAKVKGAGGAVINASGSFATVGKVSFKGNLAVATATGDNGTLTVTSPKLGKLTVALSSLVQSGQSLSGTYTIEGGTKAFAGETGTGHVDATVSPRNKFSATFS